MWDLRGLAIAIAAVLSAGVLLLSVFSSKEVHRQEATAAADPPSNAATSEIPDYSSGDTAENIWHRGPNEAYYPSTYCEWNRSGLPDEQQAICAKLDQKQNVLKPDWKTITADDGSIYKIDLHSIARFNTGSVEIAVYKDEGGGFDPTHLTKFLFDCQGHYQDETNYAAGTMYAPPRSVAGEIQRVACNG
jgi:hypothetical protein